MKQNAPYLLIGLLCVALGAAGYWIYDRQHRSAIELNIGGRGVVLETR